MTHMHTKLDPARRADLARDTAEQPAAPSSLVRMTRAKLIVRIRQLEADVRALQAELNRRP